MFNYYEYCRIYIYPFDSRFGVLVVLNYVQELINNKDYPFIVDYITIAKGKVSGISYTLINDN